MPHCSSNPVYSVRIRGYPLLSVMSAPTAYMMSLLLLSPTRTCTEKYLLQHGHDVFRLAVLNMIDKDLWAMLLLLLTVKDIDQLNEAFDVCIGIHNHDLVRSRDIDESGVCRKKGTDKFHNF